MKKSKFTESQIVFALQQTESGVTVAEVCRKLRISEATPLTTLLEAFIFKPLPATAARK